MTKLDTTEKIKIHLADDHQVILFGLKTLLQNNPNFDVVGTSNDGCTLFEEVTANQADLLIMDISMPKRGGVEVLKEFNHRGFPCKVLILSSHDDLTFIKEVMNLGASAYLTKQCASENIEEAVIAVTNDEEYFCNTIREKIFKTSTKGIPNINIPTSNTILTGREIEIITLISLEFSGKEIGEKLFISSNTVETHRKNIMKKLGAKNSISLVKYAINNKLIKS